MPEPTTRRPDASHSSPRLTGKVSDLETSLATQLTELRASVAKDVEGRVQSATEASEAARAGTQRIDKDVAGLKSDEVRLEERIASLKDANDHVAAELKVAQDGTASLKASFDTLNSTAAKPGRHRNGNRAAE